VIQMTRFGSFQLRVPSFERSSLNVKQLRRFKKNLTGQQWDKPGEDRVGDVVNCLKLGDVYRLWQKTLSFSVAPAALARPWRGGLRRGGIWFISLGAMRTGFRRWLPNLAAHSRWRMSPTARSGSGGHGGGGGSDSAGYEVIKKKSLFFPQ
jgi:hypothetical protein